MAEPEQQGGGQLPPQTLGGVVIATPQTPTLMAMVWQDTTLPNWHCNRWLVLVLSSQL